MWEFFFIFAVLMLFRPLPLLHVFRGVTPFFKAFVAFNSLLTCTLTKYGEFSLMEEYMCYSVNLHVIASSRMCAHLPTISQGLKVLKSSILFGSKFNKKLSCQFRTGLYVVLEKAVLDTLCFLYVDIDRFNDILLDTTRKLCLEKGFSWMHF